MKPEPLYLCDRKKCEHCSYPECRYTTDIKHKLKESGDCISREDAIDAVNNFLADYVPILHGTLTEIPLKCARVLYELPPVQPKQKTEQWQELKETIIELRDNDGTATQQEVCKFLINMMFRLEKQKWG